jgi:RNA polymerase sigma factor (sigma-70 family)
VPDGVAELVRGAAAGDSRAWEQLVDRYGRLVWAVTRDFRLPADDAADVFQVTWLRLLENIGRIRHPGRLGSWLATTAAHESLRCVTAASRMVLVRDEAMLNGWLASGPEPDEALLAQEQARAVRDAVSRLPSHCQRLIGLLMADPPVSYAEISDRLGIPAGSIGPTRGRCLRRLRFLLAAC